MQPLVFENVSQVNFYRSIGSIQVDLFKKFNKLMDLSFQLDSFSNFFHKIGMGWTVGLQSTAFVMFSSYIRSGLQSSLDGSEYTYPDSDFCLFAQYPHPNSMIYVLNSANLTNCTMTIRWLMSYFLASNVNMTSILKNFPYALQIYSICVDSLNGTANFGPMIAQCNLSSKYGGATLYAEDYQTEFNTELAQNLFIFIFIPIACVLGLTFSIIIIYKIYLYRFDLNQNTQHFLKDNIANYMIANSVFNSLYCVIFLFYPINGCVDLLYGSFCSSIHTSYVSQYYKIIFIAYAGEILKMCSNISIILINVNRHMLIGREHSAFLEFVSQWDFKWTIGLSVLLSAVLNIGHIFQYQLNDGTAYSENLFGFYNILYTYPFYPSINEFSLWFPLYLFIYFFINFLFFFIANASLEASIARKIPAEALLENQRRMEQMQMTVMNSDPGEAYVQHQLMDTNTSKWVTIWAVANALMNFILRSPELFFILSTSDLLFGFRNPLSLFLATWPSVRSFIVDITYFAYILTFIINFFIFSFFNHKLMKILSDWCKVSNLPTEQTVNLNIPIFQIENSAEAASDANLLPPPYQPYAETSFQSFGGNSFQPYAGPYGSPGYQPYSGPMYQPYGAPSYQPYTTPSYQPYAGSRFYSTKPQSNVNF
jgi:hypothetical protein